MADSGSVFVSFLPWLASLSTTGLLVAVLWLLRKWIAVRLTSSVQHEFNAKIQELQSRLRSSEEKLKARIREKEAEIAALRGGALSVLASRQVALDKRRLQAVDQLWESVNSLGPARAIAASMSVFKFEAAAKQAERDSRFRVPEFRGQYTYFVSVPEPISMRPPLLPESSVVLARQVVLDNGRAIHLLPGHPQ